MFVAKVGAHLLAHLANLGLQGRTIPHGGQNIAPNGVKSRLQRRVAIDHASAHQRLMLPCPGFVLLIIGKRVGGGDQHPRRAGRAQPGVNFVENTGRSAGAEQMHDPLSQPQVELTAVDLPLAVGHHLRRTVMEEHQVEIGAVAQLPTAELAVADDGEAAPLAIVQMGRQAVASHHLPPCLLHHRVEDRFGKPG